MKYLLSFIALLAIVHFSSAQVVLQSPQVQVIINGIDPQAISPALWVRRYPRPIVVVPPGSVIIRPLLPWRPLIIVKPTTPK